MKGNFVKQKDFVFFFKVIDKRLLLIGINLE